MFKRIYKKIESLLFRLLPETFIINMIKKKKGIVFLMYHSIPQEPTSYLFMTPQKVFEQQMSFLKKYFEIISISEAYQLLYEKNLTQYEKPLAVITFDDGYKDNYTMAYPILKKLSFPFTIFVTTSFIDEENKTFLSWNDLKILLQNTLVTIGAHSVKHANLRSLLKEDQIKEIVDSKNIIESHIERTVEYFAYPSGGFDGTSLNIVENTYLLGFKDRTDQQNDLDKRKVARVSIDTKHNDFKAFIINLAREKYLDAKVS